MKTPTLRLLAIIRRLSRCKGWSHAMAVQQLAPALGIEEAEKQAKAIEHETLKGSYGRANQNVQ